MGPVGEACAGQIFALDVGRKRRDRGTVRPELHGDALRQIVGIEDPAVNQPIPDAVNISDQGFGSGHSLVGRHLGRRFGDHFRRRLGIGGAPTRKTAARLDDDEVKVVAVAVPDSCRQRNIETVGAIGKAGLHQVFAQIIGNTAGDDNVGRPEFNVKPLCQVAGIEHPAMHGAIHYAIDISHDSVGYN